MIDDRARKFTSKDDAVAYATNHGCYSVLRLIGHGFVVSEDVDEMPVELPDGEWVTFTDLRAGTFLPMKHRQHWVTYDSVAHSHLMRTYDAEVISHPNRSTP